MDQATAIYTAMITTYKKLRNARGYNIDKTTLED